MLEFYTYENEVWYRSNNGDSHQLTEKSTDLINETLEQIEQFYPSAYSALCKEYEKCKPNMAFYRFRIVQRFCKCNFGNIDNIPDIDDNNHYNLECVPCPLRGECRHEHIICRPKFNHQISPAELRVLELWFDGNSKEEIADKLYLSVHTVNNHIRNAFVRLDIHSKAEFFKYAEINNLFHHEI